MKFDLFISDFDGTLGIAPAHIEQENVTAIKKYVEKGGKFVICTGRMFSSIRDICLKYGLEGIVISYQGAMINDIKTGKSLFSGGIDYELAARISSELKNEGIEVIMDIDDILYYEQPSDYVNFYRNAVKVKGELVPDISKKILDEKKQVLKVSGICDAKTAKQLTDKYNELYKGKLIINNGSENLVEVVNPKCCKGNAVEFVAKYYNIPKNKIIAVGDSTNDIELLSGEWYGVAVGDARDELKKYAKEITVPFKENPVKVLLEKYCL